jgi:DNA excision repair protein ERCC-3
MGNGRSSIVTGKQAIAFQRSGSIILDTSKDPDGEIEDSLRRFAELASAAGSMHTYRVTELSLWSAAASGLDSTDLLALFDAHSAMRIPGDLTARVTGFFGRYGQLWIEGEPGSLVLGSDDPLLLRQVASELDLQVFDNAIKIRDEDRGRVKARLAEAGYPVVDRGRSSSSRPGGYQLSVDVTLRDYQQQAVNRFVDHAQDGGVVLLPCGAGKTVVGVAIAATLNASVLIVTPNRTIGEQWAEHFKLMTTIEPNQIELFPDSPAGKPVTIVTYQSLTASRNGVAPRLHDIADIPWGLVIYDEVHTLPADVFRQSAALQSRRRLGLTATLVREDGREREVYALIGPPVWQSRWRELERQGWISPVECYEVRVRSERDPTRGDHGFAAKIRTVERIIARHPGDRILIAAHRLKEVRALAHRLGVPSVTGDTSQAERAQLYGAFRDGSVTILVVSRVANVGVDLPDANVLLQVSGTFGSRLEEAQRLGRLLRPKKDSKPARFYSLVLPDSREREFAERRQRFLVEQGYRYQVVKTRG